MTARTVLGVTVKEPDWSCRRMLVLFVVVHCFVFHLNSVTVFTVTHNEQEFYECYVTRFRLLVIEQRMLHLPMKWSQDGYSHIKDRY